MALSNIANGIDYSLIDIGYVGIISGGISKTFPVKESPLTYESLASEDSGRDDTGQMHIGWILTRTQKINITLAPMTTDEVRSILSLVQGKIYTIIYRDPFGTSPGAGHERVTSMACYTSNSSTNLKYGKLYNGLWTDTKFNAIQMKGES